VLFPRHGAPRLYDDIIASCRTAGFNPRVVQEATAWHTLAALVGAGVGSAFLPQSLTSFQRPGVVYRSIRALAVGMEMSAVWKRGDKSTVRERFVTALRAVAHSRPVVAVAR
jgi:DNA-binding transcriptional LysR family regulator